VSPPDIGDATWRPGYAGDPHPFFAEPRIPVPVSRGVVDGVPAWLVTRYEDVRRLLTDPAVSSDPRHAGPAAAAIPWVGADQSKATIRHLVRLDPPDHTRLRKLVVRAFTAGRVAALRPRVQEITDELVETLLPRGQADLVSDFALPLPVAVISELLGVPADGHEQFLHWSNVYLGVDDGDVERRPEALAHVTGYLGDLIDRKSKHPAGSAGDASLLDALIAVRDEDDRLSHHELLGMAFLLLVAGYETTGSLISNGMLALFHHPDQLAALRADPGRIAPAVEELLRYDSPVKAPVLRFTKAEIRVADTVIPAGEALVLFLSAANRDASRFSSPADLDIGRDTAGHAGFGHGVHFCLGAPLARLEAEIAFTALLTRFPELALGPGTLAWRRSFQLHSLKTLPVTFTPVPAQRWRSRPVDRLARGI
jgi:cytochrome P450